MYMIKNFNGKSALREKWGREKLGSALFFDVFLENFVQEQFIVQTQKCLLFNRRAIHQHMAQNDFFLFIRM